MAGDDVRLREVTPKTAPISRSAVSNVGFSHLFGAGADFCWACLAEDDLGPRSRKRAVNREMVDTNHPEWRFCLNPRFRHIQIVLTKAFQREWISTGTEYVEDGSMRDGVNKKTQRVCEIFTQLRRWSSENRYCRVFIECVDTAIF